MTVPQYPVEHIFEIRSKRSLTMKDCMGVDHPIKCTSHKIMNALYKLRVLCCVNQAPRQWHPLAGILFGSKDLVIPTYVQFSFDARTGGVRRLLRVRQLFVRPLRRPPLLGPRPRRVRLRQVHVQLGVGHARSVRGSAGSAMSNTGAGL